MPSWCVIDMVYSLYIFTHNHF